MSRFLPYPLLTVALALTWLLLNAPITPGSAALALLVGVSVPAVMRALQPRAVLVRAPGTLARLAVVVLYVFSPSAANIVLVLAITRIPQPQRQRRVYGIAEPMNRVELDSGVRVPDRGAHCAGVSDRQRLMRVAHE